MNTNTANFTLLFLVVLALVVSAIAYAQLPDQIATHWNIKGMADGYGSKLWGVFLFPILTVVIGLMYLVIPAIDPLKGNIKQFRRQYNLFFVGMSLFFVYLFALTIAWNFGWQFNFGVAILPACALLLWAVGMLVEKSKRNWFIGIRTPWTLSSDSVWHKTHVLGGRLFKVAAVLPLAGILLGPEIGFYLFIVPVLAIALFTVVYSYILYKRERGNKK